MIDRVLALVRAIRDGDSATVEAAVLRLSRSRRWLAPLALAVGAVTMLFEGLRLVCTNLRLMLIQILPAMWIWLALFDLKLHALHGKSFHIITGPVLIPAILVIAAITAGCYFLNAVFAFAIAAPGNRRFARGSRRPSGTGGSCWRPALSLACCSASRRSWSRGGGTPGSRSASGSSSA